MGGGGGGGGVRGEQRFLESQCMGKILLALSGQGPGIPECPIMYRIVLYHKELSHPICQECPPHRNIKDSRGKVRLEVKQFAH